MLIPALESDPVFSEAHSSCESWTVGIGAAKASKIVSNFMKGRLPSRPQIEMAIMGFVEDRGRQLALRDNGRAIIDASIAGQADTDGKEALPVTSGLWFVVRQMGCPVIFVGCLVANESSIVTAPFQPPTSASHNIDLQYRPNSTSGLLLFSDPTNPPNLSPSPGPIRMMHSKRAAPACGISRQQLLTFDKDEKQ